MRKYTLIIISAALLVILLTTTALWFQYNQKGNIGAKQEGKKKPYSPLPKVYEVGDIVDSHNGVKVFYNGHVGNVIGRNRASDGYNLGLKYQCVEFVKRYYYEFYKHKMPNSMGHAKDFFKKSISDGGYNAERNLYQYQNYSKSKPQEGDLVVWDGNRANPYGHVAIISAVIDDYAEIIQQNPGTNAPSRIKLPLIHYGGRWKIAGLGILGWLRKQ